MKLVPAAGLVDYEPTHWLLLFYERAAKDWINRWVPGRFKHVSAIGYVARTETWLFFDVQLPRTVIVAVPQDHGGELVAARWMTGKSVLRMPVNIEGRRYGVIAPWCVGAIKHLIGLRSSAFLPDGLWRDCVRNGAEVLSDEAGALLCVSASPSCVAEVSDAAPARHELSAHRA